MNKLLIVLIAVFLILAISFIYLNQSQRTVKISPMKNEFGYYDISSAELNDMLSKKDFLLVDVHMPEQKHINGTDIFIPYDELSSNLNKLPTDKNAKIVLYCRSGAMSGVASKNLVSKGYTNIYNLKNGLNEWKSLGYPL